ncbi:MAG: 5' nucleotidase, NT5C type [Marinifilaceae bacterium]
MKKRILVDMDGVLADIYKSLIRIEYGVSEGIGEIENKLKGVAEREAFPCLRETVSSPGFFRNAPLMEGSVEGLRYLNEKYDVLIVSSATEFPGCLDDKQAWLQEHFPFIGWEQMVFCGKKNSVQGDIMLDDHPKNLSYFNGKRYMFTQPHNALIEDEGFERVNNWKKVVQVL